MRIVTVTTVLVAIVGATMLDGCVRRRSDGQTRSTEAPAIMSQEQHPVSEEPQLTVTEASHPADEVTGPPAPPPELTGDSASPDQPARQDDSAESVPSSDLENLQIRKSYRPTGELRGQWQVKIDPDGRETPHGRGTEYSPKGYKLHEYTYVNGKKHGLHTMFYESGSVSTEEYFVNDKLEGLSTMYWDNGNLLAEIPYVDGKQNGTQFFYWREGGIMEEAEVIDGKYYGTFIRYDRDGNVTHMIRYIDGVKQD